MVKEISCKASSQLMSAKQHRILHANANIYQNASHNRAAGLSPYDLQLRKSAVWKTNSCGIPISAAGSIRSDSKLSSAKNSTGDIRKCKNHAKLGGTFAESYVAFSFWYSMCTCRAEKSAASTAPAQSTPQRHKLRTRTLLGPCSLVIGAVHRWTCKPHKYGAKGGT